MFSLPQPVSREQDGEGREYDVQLYDGVNDFSHYLWFVHAECAAALSHILQDNIDPRLRSALDLHAFATEQEPNVQYKRWLAIAGIAHKYQVTAVADWALNLALCVPEDLRELGKRLANVPGLVKSLLPIFTRWGPDSTQTVRTRNIIRAHLYLRAHRGPAHTYDIARCILPLEEAGDTELLAEVYYYLLVYRAETWLEDAHVRPVDRQRLFRGFHALCRRGIISGKAEEEEYSSSRVQDLRLSTLGEPLWPFFNDVNAV